MSGPKTTPKVDYHTKIKEIDEELRRINSQIYKLKERKVKLQEEKELLVDKSLIEQTAEQGGDEIWNKTNFQWYKKLKDTLTNVLGYSDFRSLQLSAINATLSGRDVIVIMPTGSGKSLCFQLPALLDQGITIVISPILSLIEDQVNNFKSRDLSYNVEMVHSGVAKEDIKRIHNMIMDKQSNLRLLYVTPERLAKSKVFMSRIQKAYELKYLSRIVIDEVHCCSQWGHDFRTDYQFLSVLKGMFPDVPIMGLTATATTSVVIDIQKMLLIQGCIVLKSSFNRPNLCYEVIHPMEKTQKDLLDQIDGILKKRFEGQSGIIYTATVKECEDVKQELKKRGYKLGSYHGQLDPEQRSRVHRKWTSNDYQIVVATIAFGLGIDKPDVRFVIHYSLPKSMENYYQESGRAGRDGEKATCILFYKFSDIFKISTMVFTQQTGISKLYSFVDFCINPDDCRRKLIASHFNEEWDGECQKMCDHCLHPRSRKEEEITEYCKEIYKLLEQASDAEVKITALMLMDTWFGKKSNKFKCKGVNVPNILRAKGETIIANLLVNGYLAEDFHFTPYATISYIKRGPKARLLDDKTHRITISVAGVKLIGEASKGSPSEKRKRTD